VAAKIKKTKYPILKIGFIIAGLLILIGFAKIYGAINAPDKQCTTTRTAQATPLSNPSTPHDYFELGNYDYDTGDCTKAIVDYTKAIELNPNFPQFYNNRAYTSMRMHNYKDALADLNKAIALNPNYVNALMNRGDIYNFYYALDRQKAIADYNRVIALGPDRDQSRSVCGHKAMATTYNIVPLAILKTINSGCL